MRERLARGETHFFPVAGKEAVGISRDGITIQMGGKSELLAINDIGGFGIKGGW